MPATDVNIRATGMSNQPIVFARMHSSEENASDVDIDDDTEDIDDSRNERITHHGGIKSETLKN